MRYRTKAITYYEMECGLLPISTDKKLPIRVQFGARGKSWQLIYGVSSSTTILSYFVNFKTLQKTVGKVFKTATIANTCCVCHKMRFMHRLSNIKHYGQERFSYPFLPDSMVVLKHHGKDHLLTFCSEPCKELFSINPLGYDLDKLYGK